MTDELHQAPDDETLAAEYALGVLDHDQRQAAAARIAADPAFAGRVAAWQERLSGLDGEFAEVTPPASAKAAIDRRLFGATPARRGMGHALWSSVALWRGLTAVTALIALVLAVVVINPTPDAPAERLIAALAPNDSDARFVALYDTATDALTVTRVAGDRPEDRDFELWLIAGDDPPVSLGLIDPRTGGAPAVPAGAGPAFAAGATLAVSLEPLGGSPTGGPTGPVVALGAVQKI